MWGEAGHACVQRIAGREEAALSCLAWARDPIDGAERLFSGGLDGALTEWDVRGRRALRSGDSYGGAVWALATEPPAALQPGDAPASLAHLPGSMHARAEYWSKEEPTVIWLVWTARGPCLSACRSAISYVHAYWEYWHCVMLLAIQSVGLIVKLLRMGHDGHTGGIPHAGRSCKGFTSQSITLAMKSD